VEATRQEIKRRRRSSRDRFVIRETNEIQIKNIHQSNYTQLGKVIKKLKAKMLFITESAFNFSKDEIGLRDNEDFDFAFISYNDLSYLIKDSLREYVLISSARIDFQDVYHTSPDNKDCNPCFTLKFDSIDGEESQFNFWRIPILDATKFTAQFMQSYNKMLVQPKLILLNSKEYKLDLRTNLQNINHLIGFHINWEFILQSTIPDPLTTIATPCPPYWKPPGGNN